MTNFSDNINDRVEDLLEIYGDDAIEFAKQEVEPDFYDAPYYGPMEPDESEIRNLNEFFETAANYIADKEEMGKSKLRDIIVNYLSDRIDGIYGEQLNDDLWQNREPNTDEYDDDRAQDAGREDF